MKLQQVHAHFTQRYNVQANAAAWIQLRHCSAESSLSQTTVLSSQGSTTRQPPTNRMFFAQALFCTRLQSSSQNSLSLVARFNHSSQNAKPNVCRAIKSQTARQNQSLIVNALQFTTTMVGKSSKILDVRRKVQFITGMVRSSNSRCG